MMNFPSLYPVTRGATLRMVLRVKAGTVTGMEVVTCTGKKIDTKTSPPPGDASEVAFTMMSNFHFAEGKEPDRWYLTLSDEDCEGLSIGNYAVDARIETPAGDVIQEAHWIIYVRERVTGPAT